MIALAGCGPFQRFDANPLIGIAFLLSPTQAVPACRIETVATLMSFF